LTNGQQAPGIDVSHYKNQIDWNRVKESGVTYAILKSTEGDNFIDSRFDYNWTRARRVGLIRGAYHFFRPLVDPVAQAQHFLRIVGDILHKTDLPPVLDVEVYPDFIKNEYKKISSQERQRRVKIWLQTVEAATGRLPMIYTEYYTWRDFLGNNQELTRYPLWIANYKVDQPKVPANNWGGRGWTFWQHTNRGVVPGIRDEAACVDLNYYIADLESLKASLKITGPRSIPPSITNGDMMAALIDAAESQGGSSDEWVARTKLRYLVDPIGNSLRPYDGPSVEELPLNRKEKRALKEALEDFSINFAALGITHQDMINAIYYAASLENIGGWNLVEQAGIGYIGENRTQIYTGPALDELHSLSWAQKEAIAAYLGVEINNHPEAEEPTEQPVDATPEPEVEVVDPGLPPTYGAEMDNQAVINAFYLMALELDVNGQEMIAAAGLEGLGSARNLVYSGPMIEDLPGLTWEIKVHLAGLLNVPIVLPNEEIKVDQIEEPEDVGEETSQEPAVETALDPVVEAESEPTPEEEAVELELPDVIPSVPVVEIPETSEPGEQLPEVEMTEPEEPKDEPFWMPIFSNQDVIEAFFQAAEKLGREGWSLLEQAGLLDLDLDRAGRFAGLAAEKIEQIGEDVTTLVVEALGMDNKKSLTKSIEVGEPYPGMVNLDIINLFYKAAAKNGQSGQQWLDDSGMAYLNKSRGSRFKPYRGPEVSGFLRLSEKQRSALQHALEESSIKNAS
jgi:lysozyme